MTIFQALILGIVQGLTEFIPVSSTAHLILVPYLLGWQFDDNIRFAFDVLLQWGTLVAVIIYFWRDLLNIVRAVLAGLLQRQPFASADAKLGWLIVTATVPAVIIGLVFKKYFEDLHKQPTIVASIVIVAALLLFGAEYIGKRTRSITAMTWLDALIIGSAQALALFPGVSRSAATICGGLARNLERPAAARFSFLMSIPVLLGAGIVALRDLLKVPNFTDYLTPLTVGFIAAAVFGFISIQWLMDYLAKRPLNAFAWYRIVAGSICLGILFMR
jgi:undecaprenyl-diphosphatase